MNYQDDMENRNNNNSNNNDNDNNDNNMIENVTTIELTVEANDIGCPGCGDEPCVFLEHEESLIEFDEVEHSGLALEDRPTNNIRRKMLYRQITLMINGGPLGAGVRRELPSCCVSAIWAMLPSETFMGFKME
jgi:hypothetical protein